MRLGEVAGPRTLDLPEGRWPGIKEVFDRFASRVEAHHPDLLPFDRPVVMMGGKKDVSGDELGDGVVSSVYRRVGWGRIWASGTADPAEGERWAFDNGAWVACHGGNPFLADDFLRRVEQAQRAAEQRNAYPVVAAVPDMLWAGRTSLEFSLRWVRRLRREFSQGWPWMLVVQDQMRVAEVEQVLDEFDGLFLGGGDVVKAAARSWCNLAHTHEKWFHYGRCGTLTKLAQAFDIGADSLDSAFPLFSKLRFQKFCTTYLAAYVNRAGRSNAGD